MATYTEMVSMVRDWSNRDKEVLSDNQITSMLKFAADEAYRSLKIPALEAVYTYTVDAGTTELTVPNNLTEVIQLRMRDTNSLTGYVVYESKSDIRSFYDEFTFKYSDYFYTRQQNKFLFCPETTGTETFELFYYGRQPAIDARYIVDTDTDEVSYQYYGDTDIAAFITRIKDTEEYGSIPFDSDKIVTIGTQHRLGKPAPNWLRDQNERIILFGALAEAFDYLQENNQAALYRQKMIAEITALNNEDKMRLSRGGNIQTHFKAPLI